METMYIFEAGSVHLRMVCTGWLNENLTDIDSHNYDPAC